MSESGSTTTKPVPAPRRGRKPKEPRALDKNNCRMCGCCFKTQFGNFTNGWISSENTFVAPTRKRETLRK